MPRLSKQKRHLSAISQGRGQATKRLRMTEDQAFALASEHVNFSATNLRLPPRILSDNSDTDLCESDSESEFSDREIDQQSSWEEDDDIGCTQPKSLDAFTCLKYKEGAKSQIRGLYGNGSKSTDKRTAREQRERARIASTCYSIADMFMTPPLERRRASSPLTVSNNDRTESRRQARKDIEDLLRLKTKMKEKFGTERPHGATFHRYELVRSFFWAEQNSPYLSRKELALQVAHSFNRGGHTARKILIWEKQWVMNREIEPHKHSSSSGLVSLLDDEGVLLATREYISGAGDSK
jgi:hypothetical protein